MCFIASLVLEILLSEGYSVVCIYNRDPFYVTAVKSKTMETPSFIYRNYELEKGGIWDGSLHRQCFINRQIDVVYSHQLKEHFHPEDAIIQFCNIFPHLSRVERIFASLLTDLHALMIFQNISIFFLIIRR